ASALHELAERDDTGAPPVAGLLRRGHRARLGRGARTATVAAAASVLVAGGVAAAVADRGEPGPVPLALAAQTTTRSAFHFRLEATLVPAIHAIRRHGGYDPVHNSAYWQTDPMGPREFFFAERQIGADCYYFHGPD